MYPLLYWKGSKGFYCEKELETKQNCNILIPTLMAISVVSFSFSNAQPEAWGPTLLAFSTASYHQLIWSPNSIGGPEDPFCWVVAFPTTSCLQLVWSPTHWEVPKVSSAGWWLSLPHLVSNLSGLQLVWLPVFTKLYNSLIAHSIFGMACLIIIKQK